MQGRIPRKAYFQRKVLLTMAFIVDKMKVQKPTYLLGLRKGRRHELSSARLAALMISASRMGYAYTR
jgi:hypothetical protein